ncbi:phage late control D family protein [Rhizobium leguminosarum]
MNMLAEALSGQADLYVPAFEVLVGQQKLARKIIRDVLEVNFHDSIDELGGFSLTLANWDAEEYAFAYSDEHLFDPGKRLDLRMGYLGAGRMNWMVRGIITDLIPSFPSGGHPTISVSGRNRLHDLLGERRSKLYPEGLDADLLRQIVLSLRDLHVDIDVDIGNLAAALRLGEVVQENEFDLLFLKRRARQLGYELIVSEEDNGTVLRLVNSLSCRPNPLKLAYRAARQGGPLLEFQPRFSTARQPENLELNSWNPVDKTLISVRVGRSSLRIKDPAFDLGSIADAVQNRTEVISSEPVQDESEGRRRATEYLERIVKDTMTATGRTVGLPELRAGTVLQIEGVGKRFSGRWFVTSSDHSIGAGGYTTSFACRREEI